MIAAGALLEYLNVCVFELLKLPIFILSYKSYVEWVWLEKISASGRRPLSGEKRAGIERSKASNSGRLTTSYGVEYHMLGKFPMSKRYVVSENGNLVEETYHGVLPTRSID